MKRFRSLLLLLLGLLLSVFSFAQSPHLILRGRVLDAGTRQPIPGAHLRVGKLGTAANADGRFELRLPESARSQQLVVSCIGYQNLERPVAGSLGRDLTLALAEAPHQLAEARVYASARAIVAQAVARIPLNYPTQPVRLTAFYREANRMFPGGQYTYLAEGLLEIHKPPYDRPGQNDQTRVVEFRKRELMPFDSTQIHWVQGRRSASGWISCGPATSSSANPTATSTASSTSRPTMAARCTPSGSSRAATAVGTGVPSTSRSTGWRWSWPNGA